MKKVFLFVCVFLIIVTSGCSQIFPTPTPTPIPTATPIPCYKNAEEYVTKTIAVLGEWDDTVKTALSTSRIQLPTVILKLQEIKRKAEAISPPVCNGKIHEYLLSYMKSTIDAYTSFMANESAEVVQLKFSFATEYSNQVLEEMNKIKSRKQPFDH